jgi:hypothetical protein
MGYSVGTYYRDNYYLWQVCPFHFHPAASHCAFAVGGPAIAKGVEAANRMPAMRAPRTNLAVICNSSKRFVAVTGSAGEPYGARGAHGAFRSFVPGTGSTLAMALLPAGFLFTTERMAPTPADIRMLSIARIPLRAP